VSMVYELETEVDESLGWALVDLDMVIEYIRRLDSGPLSPPFQFHLLETGNLSYFLSC